MTACRASIVMDARDRVLVAAKVTCIRYRVTGMDLHYDLANEVAVMQMQGIPVRLDYQGMNWLLDRILARWLGSRVKEETKRNAKPRLAESTSPIAFVQLGEIWGMATTAQREAIFTLMHYGPIKWGLNRTETRRKSNALRALREKLGIKPVSVTRHDRWKRKAA